MNREQRALHIWTLLVCATRERRTSTYSDIATILGLGREDFVRRPLGSVMYYCQRKGLPPLTALVVNKSTGQPGNRFDSGGPELNKARKDVFNQDWFNAEPPESASVFG